jgi:hypothetical protein
MHRGYRPHASSHAQRVPATRIIARTEGTGHTHHRTHRGYWPHALRHRSHALPHASRVLAACLHVYTSRVPAACIIACCMTLIACVEGTGRMHASRVLAACIITCCMTLIACVEGTGRTLASHASRVPTARLHRMRRGYRPHASCMYTSSHASRVPTARIEGAGRTHHACIEGTDRAPLISPHASRYRSHASRCRPHASRVPAARIMHASRVPTARIMHASYKHQGYRPHASRYRPHASRVLAACR